MRTTSWLGIGFLAMLGSTAKAQFVEVEPNETKVQALANGEFVLSPGATLSGTTTGAVTVAGLTSRDLWLVRTTPLPAGIYRHRLVLTSAVGTHTVLIMATNYVLGTDSTAQISATSTTPPKHVQWYGFGREERLYIDVRGNSLTTAPYTLTFETTPVAPEVIPGAFAIGNIEISSIGLHLTDNEIHIYDNTLREIFDYQNDDPFGFPGTPCRLDRPYSSGTFYVAVSRYNQTSTWPSASGVPSDPLHYYPNSLGGERTRQQVVLDFHDVACTNSTATATAPISFQMTDSAAPPRTQLVPATATGPYQIHWFQFTVGSDGACASPAITAPPMGIDVCFGNSVTFSVTATGTAPLAYQWSYGNLAIPGANGATLTIPAVDFTFAGAYTCRVSNACGQVDSQPALLTVHPAGPEILQHPSPQTLCVGEPATFSVVAQARMTGLLSYQWSHDGLPIPGATASTLQFAVTGLADGGQYVCEVTELGCGHSDSSAALLTVRNAAPVITLVGSATVNLECGHGDYVEQGATVGDDCDTGLTVTIGGAVVDSHTIGHYVITYDAVDSLGNHAATVRRDVYVVDTEAPVVQVAVATSILWSPDHSLVNVGLGVQTSDHCDPTGAAANVLVHVFADEVELPDTGDGSGQHSPDAKDLAPNQLRLRSERRGNSDGRVYLIVVSTSDASGNEGFAFASVVCPGAQSQTALATVQTQANAMLAQAAASAASTPRLGDVMQAIENAGYLKIGDAPVRGPQQ